MVRVCGHVLVVVLITHFSLPAVPHFKLTEVPSQGVVFEIQNDFLTLLKMS